MPNDTYKNQLILHQGEARLIPPNSDYPDCMCLLVLTESRLYVMERRFDGTYDEYFSIPLRQLRRFEVFEQKDGRKFAPLTFLLGLLGGMLVVDDTWEMKKRDYLEIDYCDPDSLNNGNLTIRFHEMDGSVRRLAKEWRKYLPSEGQA